MSGDVGSAEVTRAGSEERATMLAIVQREFGEAGVLRAEEVAVPIPAEGEVRIRVAAAGVHAVDTDIRRGTAPASMPKPALPMTPGREVAGFVDAVGSGVDAALLGTRVVAHLGFRSGGYAEFALASAQSLHSVDAEASFSQAVATIGTGRTAQLVWESANIRPDDVVLIPGASGGLGSQLVQLALSAGATVIALYGGEVKRPVVERLAHGEKFADGRLLPLDVTVETWPEQMAARLDGAQPSVLIDGVGGATGRTALETLGSGARVVIIGWSSGEALRLDTDDILQRSLTVAVPLGRPIADLRALESRALAALAEGRTAPPVDEYRLDDAATAHEAIEQRRQRGKVVLVPSLR